MGTGGSQYHCAVKTCLLDVIIGFLQTPGMQPSGLAQGMYMLGMVSSHFVLSMQCQTCTQLLQHSVL